MGSNCPVCDTPIDPKGISESITYKYAVSHFQSVAQRQKQKATLAAEEKVQQIVQRMDVNLSSVFSVASANISAIKSSPEELKTYISHLLQIEGNIHAIKQRLVELYGRQIENEQYAIFCEWEPTMEQLWKRDFLKKQIVLYRETIEDLKQKLSVFPTKPKEPEYLPEGFWDVWLLNLQEQQARSKRNKQRKEEYENALNAYNEAVVANSNMSNRWHNMITAPGNFSFPGAVICD